MECVCQIHMQIEIADVDPLLPNEHEIFQLDQVVLEECLCQIHMQIEIADVDQLLASDNGFVALVLVFRAQDRELESFSWEV